MAMALITCLLFVLLLQFCCPIICTTTCNITKILPKLFPAVLIFGDSTVDTGNNNKLNTVFKGNHWPYGQDFPGRIPTGRLSNGKLIPDFVISTFGLKEFLPPFLQPNIADKELLTGVCFASAGAGFDELTTLVSGGISMSRQTEYFKEYKHRLATIVGENKSQNIVAGALVIISAGIDDLAVNYYDLQTRRLQFSMDDYQDYLHKKLQNFLKELYDLGCRNMVITGLPPIGCLPIQMTAKLSIPRRCINEENSDARSYNEKLLKLLPQIQQKLPGSKILYADIYTHLMDMIINHEKYGFVETTKGCCGTGLLEGGILCNEFTPVCRNSSLHIFWDCIHPAELTYRYMWDRLFKDLLPYFLHSDCGGFS